MTSINPSLASNLAFPTLTLTMGTAPTDGQTLVRSGTTITGQTVSAGVGGSTGSVDNALLRADGTGGSTLQAGATATLSDAGLITATATTLTAAIAVSPASPYTHVAGITTITLASSGTINLLPASTYTDTTPIRIINSSASSITVTLDPDGTDTIDGGSAGASAAYTVAARGSVGCVRLTSSTWGSVQSGSTVGASALRGYMSDGVWYAIGCYWSGTAWVDVGSAVAGTARGTGGGTTLSGTTWTLPTTTAATTRPDPTTVGASGQCYDWALSAFSLPTFGGGATVSVLLRVGTRPTVQGATLGVTCLSGAWSTNSQIIAGIGLWYDSNKSVSYIWGTNFEGSATNNANFDEVVLHYTNGQGIGDVIYRTTSKTTVGSISGVAAPGNAITHIGVSLHALILTASSAAFVNPEWFAWINDR